MFLMSIKFISTNYISTSPSFTLYQDLVYKEMKLLWASVRSSQKIDKSFEKIFNILFYFAIACIILGVLGYDPIAVFLSLSSIVLAFSFMISQASSKYVEGLLFILYRRPYDIGVSSAIFKEYQRLHKNISDTYPRCGYFSHSFVFRIVS